MKYKITKFKIEQYKFMSQTNKQIRQLINKNQNLTTK